ncbi:hypothetical protein BJP36_17830 [Moorena producens JHB]|uniref:Uncharacterized protein n=1 Tax=Moorena producens (strain JHB) TaxID=1454205 RepID=A0A1D9G1K4_MOOP1|nr:hypothetical protein [Moorena producens]AOY81497.1 hypothetical protein BJP36_17830 [Moorena producens JHB]
MEKLHLSIRSLVTLVVTIAIVAASFAVAPAVLALQIYPTADLGSNTRIKYHRSDWVKVQSKQSATLAWNCPSNAHTVGGGFESRPEQGNASSGFTVIHSFPSSDRQWRVRLRNQDDIARDVRIYNICAE